MEQRCQIVVESDAAELFTEVLRLKGCDHHSLELLGTAQCVRDGQKPARGGAAEQRRPCRRRKLGVQLIRAEIGPVGQTERRGSRVIGVVTDPTVRSDNEDGAHKGKVTQSALHQLLESRVVLLRPLLEVVRVRHGCKGEGNGLESAYRLLLDQGGQRRRGLPPALESRLPARQYEPCHDRDGREPGDEQYYDLAVAQ